MADNPGHIVLPVDDVDSYAIQALFRGEASPEQQVRAMKCLIHELCGTYNMTFDPDNGKWQDFNEGKRHIGRTLVNISTINVGIIKQNARQLEKSRTPQPVQVTRKRKS